MTPPIAGAMGNLCPQDARLPLEPEPEGHVSPLLKQLTPAARPHPVSPLEHPVVACGGYLPHKQADEWICQGTRKHSERISLLENGAFSGELHRCDQWKSASE
jgi:hypothetical protein